MGAKGGEGGGGSALDVGIGAYNTQKGGSMSATIRPNAIILTKVQRTVISMMVKGCIVALTLHPRCFFISLPNNIQKQGRIQEFSKGGGGRCITIVGI